MVTVHEQAKSGSRGVQKFLQVSEALKRTSVYSNGDGKLSESFLSFHLHHQTLVLPPFTMKKHTLPSPGLWIACLTS